MKFCEKRMIKVHKGKVPGPYPKGRENLLEDAVRETGEEAMATVEYAIVTLAAVGLAGLLVLILRSGEVRNLLMDIVVKALSSFPGQ